MMLFIVKFNEVIKKRSFWVRYLYLDQHILYIFYIVIKVYILKYLIV